MVVVLSYQQIVRIENCSSPPPPAPVMSYDNPPVVQPEQPCADFETTSYAENVAWAEAAFALSAAHRWCLSGTPLQNRVGELYSLVQFLRLDPYCYYFCRAAGCEWPQPSHTMRPRPRTRRRAEGAAEGPWPARTRGSTAEIVC